MDGAAGIRRPRPCGRGNETPVAKARPFVRDMLEMISLPRNWLVDSKGVLQPEQTGFDPNDAEWVGKTVASLQKLTAAR